MKIKHLLFDIDGTLIDSDGAGRRAMCRALEPHIKSIDRARNFGFAGKTDTHIITELLGMSGIRGAQAAGLLEEVKEAYIRNLAEELQRAGNVRVYSGVRELLASVQRHDRFEQALLTGNFQKGARLKLGHAGLWDHFTWGAFGDLSGDRVHLAEEARRIIAGRDGAIDGEDIVVIGDTSHDVRCGQAIGATTVAVTTGFESEEQVRSSGPDHVIRSMSELGNILGL